MIEENRDGRKTVSGEVRGRRADPIKVALCGALHDWQFKRNIDRLHRLMALTSAIPLARGRLLTHLRMALAHDADEVELG